MWEESALPTCPQDCGPHSQQGYRDTESPFLAQIRSDFLKPWVPFAAVALNLEGCDQTTDIGLTASYTSESNPTHSPSCGPCWQLPSVPAAGLGSSLACQAGEDLLTTRNSGGTGECHCGPAARCERVHTDPSYPSGLPGKQGQGKGKNEHPLYAERVNALKARSKLRLLQKNKGSHSILSF